MAEIFRRRIKIRMTNFDKLVKEIIDGKQGALRPHLDVICGMSGGECLKCPLNEICNRGANPTRAEEWLTESYDKEVNTIECANKENSDSIFEHLRKFAGEIGAFKIIGEHGIEIEIKPYE